MRTLLVVIIVVTAGCGGGGKCEFPPCDVPELTCDSDADCFESELCDFERDSCGALATDVGRCVRRPASCTGEVDLVCGCDGQIHSNPCVAASQGVDTNNGGGCAVPPNAFACGPRACDRSSQVCIDNEIGGSSHFFQCESFPMQCTVDRSCPCLASFSCGQCIETNGTFTLKCRLSPDPAEASLLRQ